MKIKIDISKDKTKNQYYEIQKHEKSTITIIYIDKSDIKDKIDEAIYDATINEARHQHLEKDIHYNIFTAKLTALQLAIEILWENHEWIE